MVDGPIKYISGKNEMSEFKRNHYVPQWYQKRFLEDSSNKLYYLDLYPNLKVSGRHRWRPRALTMRGTRGCFVQDDLYTTNWFGIENREIERFFFGKWDKIAPQALDHFQEFSLKDISRTAFENLLTYMSLQKLRTPKGLLWLSSFLDERDRNKILIELQSIRNLFCAIWTECVWQIADASDSNTKFIISDHPVVAYNRECPPGSIWCKNENSPDIRFVATHTYFPLNLNKILIMTNLSWVRDPYQKPRKLRPNPAYFRNSIFNFLDIQINRKLSEEEVCEINYITKLSSYRYVASAKKNGSIRSPF